jgi:limonene-1,2-epoxide hydrolase
MKLRKHIAILILAATAGAIVVGCISRGGDMTAASNAHLYQLSLEKIEGDRTHVDLGVSRFTHAFEDLTAPDLEQRLIALYADELFFNDTIHTFHRREDLLAYLVKTGAALKHSHIEIEQVISDGADVFVRWTMDFQTRAAGRDIHSTSIGMTHLRFNTQGQAVLHQDFWDSGHALYAHLPVIGPAIRSARKRMQDP